MVLGTRSHRAGDVWSVQLRPVVDQMSADKMSSGQGTDERQLPSHDGSSDDPGEMLGVLSWNSGMGTFDSQHLKDCLLRSEHSAAAYGTDFNAWHCHSHKKILAVVGSETTGEHPQLK